MILIGISIVSPLSWGLGHATRDMHFLMHLYAQKQ